MTEEKILDLSFPFVASVLVAKLAQLVYGELVASTQVFLGRFPRCSHNTISSGWRALLRSQRTNEPWGKHLLSLLLQSGLLQLCQWLQVEWFQGWGEYAPLSLKHSIRVHQELWVLREFYILSTHVAVPFTRALCWILLWTLSLMLNAPLYVIGILMNLCGIAWKAQFALRWCDCCCFPRRSIVQSDEKLVISASWAKDDDISRLLKSLPNWSNMAQPKQLRPKREEEEDFIR